MVDDEDGEVFEENKSTRLDLFQRKLMLLVIAILPHWPGYKRTCC
jgi:hypothetical protein